MWVCVYSVGGGLGERGILPMNIGIHKKVRTVGDSHIRNTSRVPAGRITHTPSARLPHDLDLDHSQAEMRRAIRLGELQVVGRL